jgi:hypothetical protein
VTEPATGPPDQALRRQVFRIVLGVALAFVLGSHALERWMSYPLNRPVAGARRPPKPGIIRHGSYGFSLARYDFVPGFRSVVLLGNSVYQYCAIAPRMQERVDQERRRLAFYNLSQTGAGIHDHVVQAAAVLPRRPDLMVVSVFGLSFTSDYGRLDALPRFRTDADQMVFENAPARALPWSFLRRELDHAAAADALLSSLLPLKRVDTPLRADVGAALGLTKLGAPTHPLLGLFSWPRLNRAADWIGRTQAPARQNAAAAARLYPETDQLLEELVAMAARYDVPLLFIWQEAGPRFAEPDARAALARACARYPKASLADLSASYVQDEYMEDEIHPLQGAPRDACAERHLRAILAALGEP